MDNQATKVLTVTHLGGGSSQDSLAVEEPLEIRLGYGALTAREEMALAITMRTPGADEDLATGFLLTEGLISAAAQIRSIGPCGKTIEGQSLRVELAPEVALDRQQLARHFYTTSSCGVCGKTALDALHVAAGQRVDTNKVTISARVLQQLPARMDGNQPGFALTGGLHAAALFDVSGQLTRLREDVGRHNAVDKLIGAAALANDWPVHEQGLLLSGRASFELVQKAVMASIPWVAAIGAPSSLAVAAAERFGITLIGFLRADRGNVYSHGWRVV